MENYNMKSEFKNQVKVGDNLLDMKTITFNTRSEEGDFKSVSTQDIFADRRVIVFGLPGAFTPTCSTQQLPSFDMLYESFKERGIDEVFCLSVNDTFVMNAWFKDVNVTCVKAIPDGNAEFTSALGLDVAKLDLGFGTRSWRYAMVVDNGVVEVLSIEDGFPNNLDDPDPYSVSSPEAVLSLLDS